MTLVVVVNQHSPRNRWPDNVGPVDSGSGKVSEPETKFHKELQK